MVSPVGLANPSSHDICAHLGKGEPVSSRLPVPPPKKLITELAMRDGRLVEFRPVRPADAALLIAFGSEVSPDDLRMRFFTPLKDASHFMCEIAHVDGIRRFGLIAQQHRCILGVAQLVIDSEYNTAEFALLIRSDRKRRGFGTALLERITHYAHSIGLGCLTADVLRENDAMLGLAERLRFQVSASPADRSMLHLSLMLRPTHAVPPRWIS